MEGGYKDAWFGKWFKRNWTYRIDDDDDHGDDDYSGGGNDGDGDVVILAMIEYKELGIWNSWIYLRIMQWQYCIWNWCGFFFSLYEWLEFGSTGIWRLGKKLLLQPW